MTDKQCFEQAIKDYERVCELFNGKDYQDCVEICRRYNFDFFHLDDELFDINFGTACFTINNVDGKGKVNPNSIELWNDEECNCLGDYTLEEIKGELL